VATRQQMIRAGERCALEGDGARIAPGHTHPPTVSPLDPRVMKVQMTAQEIARPARVSTARSTASPLSRGAHA
jgi:hypothetical protein